METFMYMTLLLSLVLMLFSAMVLLVIYCHRKERKMYTLLDHMPDLVWLTNAKGKYTYVNEAFAVKILMCSSSQAIGKTIRQIANEQLLIGISNNFGTIFTSTDDATRDFGTARKFLEIGKINNRFVALETIKTPLYDRSKFIGMLGIARDVTHDVTEHALLDNLLEKGDMEAFKKLFNDHKFKYINSPAKSCYPEFLRRVALEEIT